MTDGMQGAAAPGQAARTPRALLSEAVQAELERIGRHGIVAGVGVGRKLPLDAILDAVDAYAAAQERPAPGEVAPADYERYAESLFAPVKSEIDRLRAAIGQPEPAGERPAPSGEPLSHFFHCWRFPAHHACAVALIERQAEENDRLVISTEHPAAEATAAPGHLAAMRGTIAVRDAEIRLLRMRLDATEERAVAGAAGLGATSALERLASPLPFGDQGKPLPAEAELRRDYAQAALDQAAEDAARGPLPAPWTEAEFTAALDGFYAWFTVGVSKVRGRLLGSDATEFARALHAQLDANRAHREPEG